MHALRIVSYLNNKTVASIKSNLVYNLRFIVNSSSDERRMVVREEQCLWTLAETGRRESEKNIKIDLLMGVPGYLLSTLGIVLAAE